MNLAIRDMRRNLGQFVLTCFGLSLLLGVVISMIGIYRGMVDDAINLIEQPQVDLWIVEGGTRGPFAEASHLPGDIRESVARINGVAAAGALTYQSVETRYKERKVRIYVVGSEPGRIGGPGPIIDGRDITQTHFEMVADVKTGFALGERVTLGRDTYTVVGLIRDQVSASGDPVVYIPLKDSQTLQFDLMPSAARRESYRGTGPMDTPDTVNAVVARVDRTQHPEQAAATIMRWKHLAVMTSEQQQEIMIGSVVEQSRKQIGMFTILLLIVSAVIIALIIHTLTMNKRREIATLCAASPYLHWLPAEGVVAISTRLALVGHDGWADARFGDYERSLVQMNDYFLIAELSRLDKLSRRNVLERLSDEASLFFHLAHCCLDHRATISVFSNVGFHRHATHA